MKRKNQIEGLRAIGCLLVFLSHTVYRYARLYQGDFELSKVATIFRFFGDYGVLLFFIISFYFMGNKKNKENLDVLLIKRYIKLWIPYVISISITYIMEQFLDLHGRCVSFKQFLLNLTMVHELRGIPYVDRAHWYIFTILVLTVWILVIENTLKYKVTAYFGLMLFAQLVLLLKPDKAFYFQSTYISIAVFVIMIRFLLESDKRISWHNCYICVVTVVALAITVYNKGIAYGLFTVAFYAVFLLCYNNKLPLMGNKVFVYIGSLSLYIYLIHQNVSYMILNTISGVTGSYHSWYFIFCIPFVYILAILIKVAADTIFRLINPLVKKL